MDENHQGTFAVAAARGANAALVEVAEAMGAETLDIHDPDLEFFSDEDLRQLEERGMTVARTAARTTT